MPPASPAPCPDGQLEIFQSISFEPPKLVATGADTFRLVPGGKPLSTVTTARAAEYLGLSQRKILELIDEGAIRARRRSHKKQAPWVVEWPSLARYRDALGKNY